RQGLRRPARPAARPLRHEGRERPRARRRPVLARLKARAAQAARPGRAPRRPLAVHLPLEAHDMKLLPGPLRRRAGKEEEKAEARPNGDGRATALRRPNAPDKEAKEREKEANRERLKKSALEIPIATVGWLDERTGGGPFLRGFLYRKVPKGTNWYYTLGSATMFAFLSQAVTGVFLAMYYRTSATEAYPSVQHITNDVFLGEFVG